MPDEQKKLGKEYADKDIEIINNLEQAPTYFVDGVQGFTVVNGTARINLYQLVQDFRLPGPESEPKKVIIARLALSPDVVASITRWLGERVKDLKEAEKSAEAARSSAGPSDGN